MKIHRSESTRQWVTLHFIVLMVGNLVFLFSPFLKLSPFFRSSRASAPCTVRSIYRKSKHFPGLNARISKYLNHPPAQGIGCLMQPKGPLSSQMAVLDCAFSSSPSFLRPWAPGTDWDGGIGERGYLCILKRGGVILKVGSFVGACERCERVLHCCHHVPCKEQDDTPITCPFKSISVYTSILHRSL